MVAPTSCTREQIRAAAAIEPDRCHLSPADHLSSWVLVVSTCRLLSFTITLCETRPLREAFGVRAALLSRTMPVR
jgi:hypothetical protein